MQPQSGHPFDALTPDFIMDAVESLGFVCDCRILALNSYENRVYQVGIEDKEPLIVKFYRPQRWSDDQIREEHAFCFELEEQELPVVAPWRDSHGESLFHYQGFSLALFPRRGGHAPEFDNLDNLYILGRLLGRIHRVGASRPFHHRPAIDLQSYGRQSIELLTESFVPQEYHESWQALSEQLLQNLEQRLTDNGHCNWIRVHGDCHSGNMLWREGAPHFVDFDDARSAPAVQDIWMLLSGDRFRQQDQLGKILEGYHQFCDFDLRELRLIEPLRTLRMLYHSAWLAKRWDDPAFPRAFPWFNTMQFWTNQIIELREQLAALQEQPLQLVI